VGILRDSRGHLCGSSAFLFPYIVVLRVAEYISISPLLSFLACDSIYAIACYMPSPVRLSVRPAVCHTGGSVKDGYS